MLNQQTLDKLILLDLESTSQFPTFESIDKPILKELFYKRFEKEIEAVMSRMALPEYDGPKESAVEQVYSLKAPLLAEFGKVIAISIGVLLEVKGLDNEQKEIVTGYKLQTLNLSGDDEKALLTDFLLKCKKISEPKTIGQMKHTIVAYNGLVFDIPFLAKRLILNGMDIPVTLDVVGLKPWNVSHVIDPCDHWAMMSWNSHTSLDLLCAIFGVESSKSDMSGTDVKDVYWKEKNLKKISEYCEKDIVALAKVYLKMQGNKKELIK